MRKLWLVTLLLAAPAFADEIAVDFTGSGNNGQAVQFAFDLNTLTGTFTHSDFAFQALGVAVSNWSGSIDGKLTSSLPTSMGQLDGVDWATTTLTIKSVSAPEPGTAALLLLGMALLLLRSGRLSKSVAALSRQPCRA